LRRHERPSETNLRPAVTGNIHSSPIFNALKTVGTPTGQIRQIRPQKSVFDVSNTIKTPATTSTSQKPLPWRLGHKSGNSYQGQASPDKSGASTPTKSHSSLLNNSWRQLNLEIPPLLRNLSVAQVGLQKRPWDGPNWRTLSSSPQSTTANTQLPYPVRRFEPGKDEIETIPYSRQQGRQAQIPGDICSGKIITMLARLKELGFHKEDEPRWFVVLGNVKGGTGLVVLLMSTFHGRGKLGLGWRAGLVKPMERATEDGPRVDLQLDSNQAVFTKNHADRAGSTVLLANAFVVEMDKSGTLPAKFDGYLIKESFDDVLGCVKHLITHHEREAQYFFSRDINDWELGEIKNTVRECCSLFPFSLGD
jgi:hypothetical protein